MKQRRAASRPRFWLGVAALLIAVFFGVGGLLSVMMAERARAAQARAMAARNQALVQQAIALRAAAATRPSLVDADDDALGVSTPMD